MASRGAGSLALLLVGVLAGCGGKPPVGGAGGPGGGSGGGLPVQIEPVREADLADASEYLATIKSRRSVNVEPQAEGVITQIFVKSGDRVRPGAPLLQIDAGKQRAAVRTQEATRAMKRAALDYAEKEEQRAKTLYEAGAVARQFLDQAESALHQAKADYDALGAQVEQQEVELRYYRVTAPAAGVVGDIPVRVGDRVTTQTLLTTLDENTGLEAYIAIPLERAKDLRTGQAVEILGGDGTVLAATAINYIAPQVDDQTQSVLVKAPVPAGSFRASQVARARVIWSRHKGPVLPLLAVTRTSGQYFAFVAEPGPGGQGLVAHQRPVQLGQVVGNDYEVLAGVHPGDRVVTGGVQKLADGAPITPLPPSPSTPSNPGAS